MLAGIHCFELVIGWFPPMFAGLDRSRSIVRSTALGVALSLFGGFTVVYKKLEIDFIRETRDWVWKYWLWIWWSQPACPYFFWTVSHLFLIWTSEMDVFFFISAVQCPNTVCETVLNTWSKFYLLYISGGKCILGQWFQAWCEHIMRLWDRFSQ